MNNIVISHAAGSFVFRRNAHVGNLMKSQAAQRGDLVSCTVFRLAQLGRDEMSPEQKFFRGGAAFGMVSQPVQMFCTPATRQAIRDALVVKSAAQATAFDAGRASEADVLHAINAVEKGEAAYDDGESEGRDADGNLIVETFRKSDTAPELLRKAYKSATEDGAVSIREAAAELDRLVEQFKGR